MVGEIWLHVGTGKTGTSAVQVALARHRVALAEAGLSYPQAMDDEQVALDGGITSGNAKRLGWLAAPRLRPPEFDAAAVERWVDDALAEAGPRPVLFSSETLQAPVPAEFAPVLARLRAGGRRVRVLYLVRHALDHAVASYAQGLKIGDPPDQAPDLATHLERHEVPFQRQLANWEGILGGAGDILCRLYDQERLGEGLARNLLRCIDPAFAAALPADAAPESVNRTPTGIELALYDRLARDPEAGRDAARWATRGVLNAPAAVAAPIAVPEASFAAFARRNTRVVEAVNRRFFGGEPVLRLTAGRIPVGATVPLPEAAVLDTAAAMLLGVAREARAEAARLRAQLAAARQRRPAPAAAPPPAPAAEPERPREAGPGGVAARARRLAADARFAEALQLLDAALAAAPTDEDLAAQRARIARRAARQG